MIKRGFASSEFEARVERAQALMQTHEISSLLLTTEPDVRYFTGFLTQFWQSPTRPWFLIVPASGKPVAVIPSIGRALMASTWIEDIRTWASPDLKDDGVSLLADTLGEVSDGGRVAIPDGHETHLRMPVSDFVRLKNWISIGSDNGIMRSLRMVKSEAEIDKIRHACAIGGQAFDAVQVFAKVGMTQSDISRAFQSACLDAGADAVPYVAMGLGQNGYHDVISPAADQVVAQGDVLMLDTGLVWDGYFCDFDRNYSFGPVTPMVSDCFAKLLDATEVGLQTAKVGATAADVLVKRWRQGALVMGLACN